MICRLLNQKKHQNQAGTCSANKTSKPQVRVECCCHVLKCCGDKCKSNAAHPSSNDSAWSNQPHAFLQLSERPWTTRNWHGPATGQHHHALSAHWVNYIYIPGAITPRKMSKANTSCCNFLSLFVWMSGFKHSFCHFNDRRPWTSTNIIAYSLRLFLIPACELSNQENNCIFFALSVHFTCRWDFHPSTTR